MRLRCCPLVAGRHFTGVVGSDGLGIATQEVGCFIGKKSFSLKMKFLCKRLFLWSYP